PGFLALYGNEWGVISNGGHLNIYNPDGLAEWEYNSSSQLIGSVATIKSDYANLYSVMKARGWIGQFNHPASSGQFQIGGTALAYDANGAQVMVAAEILNSSAFSTNTTETETSRSTYSGAFNILLERGYHVAPTSDQDNHCANWGLSFRNRTGVLLANGATLNVANFLDAMKARRVFATEDKTAQVVLTGNGQVMGQSISNSGALTLAANYASASGGSAQRVQFFEGVPGRNGTVSQLFEGAGTYSFTPANGEHFYYALVTEADGDRLWSAPIWVSQGGAPPPVDTTPPTVSASETGSSGSITLSATASDNVGVSKVEFNVDGVLKGSDTSSPYSIALDSTTLTSASHSLTAKAFDAAGNASTSAAVSFTVSNAASTQFNEAESNGSVATANTVAHAIKTIVGTMGNSTDKDYFALALAANETVKIAMVGPVNDYDLYLVNASDTSLKSSTGGTSTETVTYTNGASAATVYAKVIAYSGSGTSPYTLTLTYTAGSGGGGTPELLGNPGFESGNTAWTASSGVIDNGTSQASHAGSWKAWMNGYGSAHTDTVKQNIVIPATATGAFSFWLKVVSDETSTSTAYDTLKVQVRNSAGTTVLATLATYSNLNKGTSYVLKSFDLGAWKGQTVQIYFEGIEGSTTATSFLVDDASIK
ncbi:MAG: Ig-like domain-containing protein, partial [Arenimonas sp.]